MITLSGAQVFKYKSIENSSPVIIGEGVTVLVGKNESGKTAFLEALHKALPLGNAKFDFVFDYPRKDYVRYRSQHDAKKYARVVELTFRIDKELASKINNEVFYGASVIKAGATFTRTTNYGNGNTIGLVIDEVAALAAPCAVEIKSLHSLVQRNRKMYAFAPKTHLRNALFFVILAAVFIGFGIASDSRFLSAYMTAFGVAMLFGAAFSFYNSRRITKMASSE